MKKISVLTKSKSYDFHGPGPFVTLPALCTRPTLLMNSTSMYADFPPGGSSDQGVSDRLKLAFAHRQHLNRLFLEDLTRKFEENSNLWLDKEVRSYIKHAKGIRTEFKDVADDAWTHTATVNESTSTPPA